MAEASNAILSRLLELHPKLIDLSLDRVETLLSDLGNPQDRLPPVIHVAGTNGKGSVVAILRAILEAAGLKVHVYTSPHLVSFHERIRLAGDLITEDHLADLLAECEQVNAGRAITFFEITTVAAFLAFSRVPADVVLLETGLGGRLDATNMVTKPLLTLITPIDMDHEHFLGDTIDKIALEKAHIMKPDVPCLTVLQRPKAAKVLRDHAAKLGVELLEEDKDWTANRIGQALVVQARGRRRNLGLPSLPGDHQVRNAGLVVAALFTQTALDIPGGAYNQGLGAIDWPGRLQQLATGPLVQGLKPDQELWLDGGHNAGASRALAAFLSAWADKPQHIVMGMLKSREPQDFLKPLKNLDLPLTMVTIPNEDNAWQAEHLAEAAIALGMTAGTADTVEQAIEAASVSLPKGGRVMVCGSLYLCGYVLKDHG